MTIEHPPNGLLKEHNPETKEESVELKGQVGWREGRREGRREGGDRTYGTWRPEEGLQFFERQ
jgi:hypothetical protein